MSSVAAATDQIELINQPLLMIAGSKAESLYMTEDAFAKASGTKDKELFKIDGATHIETYWVPKYVDAATQKLAEFHARPFVLQIVEQPSPIAGCRHPLAVASVRVVASDIARATDTFWPAAIGIAA
jgi:hypothetical protein